jgi:hypothetical protein
MNLGYRRYTYFKFTMNYFHLGIKKEVWEPNYDSSPDLIAIHIHIVQCSNPIAIPSPAHGADGDDVRHPKCNAGPDNKKIYL